MIRILLALALIFASPAFAQTAPNINGSGCSIASATNIDIGASCQSGQLVTITGTTAITSFGSTASVGSSWLLYFTSTASPTNSATLNMTGNANQGVAANYSLLCYVPATAGTWYCTMPLFGGTWAVSGSGSWTAARFLPTSSTASGNSLYLSAANTPSISCNGAICGSFSATALTTPFGIVRHVRLPTDAASVAVAATDDYVGIITTTQAVAANLYATPTTGQTFTICDISNNGATRNITVTPAAGNIDAAATFVINTNSGCWTGFYTGTLWKTVSSR